MSRRRARAASLNRTFGGRLVPTSSSLTLRALLKTAVARSGAGRPPHARLGPDAAGEGAATSRRRAGTPHGVVLVVVPTDADVEQIVARRPVLPRGARGPVRRARPSARCCRSRRTKSIRIAAWRRTSTSRRRARARPARARARARRASSSRRRAALLPRLSAPGAACGGRPRRSRRARRSRRSDLGERLARRRLHAARIRSTSTASSASAAASSTSIPAAEAQPIRLEFIGDTIESIRAVRRRRRSGRSRRSIRSSIVPLRELLGDPAAPDDPAALDRVATIVDYVRRAGADRSSCSRSTTSSERGRDARGAVAHERGRACGRAAGRRRRSTSSLSPWDDARRAGSRPATRARASWRSTRPTAPTPARTSRVSRPSSIAAASATGSRRSGARASAARRSCSSRRRRAAPSARSSCSPDYDDPRARRSSDADDLARRGGARRDRPAVARIPPARTPALQLFAETDVFEEERRVARAAPVGRAHVPLRLPRPEGRRPRRPRRPRHRPVRRPEADRRRRRQRRRSSWSSATPATTSSSSRSSGSTSSRSTPAAPRRRSTGSAARRGRRPRRASRRPCATWPRSCSSSTPRARPSPGHAFSPDSHWQQEFEDAFEYELTPDQQTAIADIKRDMESPTPMDRLLCGDVGYGKTEVAMRAAFKAVMDGKQVAFLAPTTVLAFQHLKTLQRTLRRLPRAHRHGQPLPHRRPSRSRRSPSSPPARSTSSSARTGCCRRTSQFRDLGLLVVDEEQRFGVAHKERIKQLRKKVDVLTMTATPIPRTLNMSLVGIRDMSVIETPPRDRLSIQTQRRQVRPGRDRARDPHRARARRAGLLRPQPRRVDLLDRQPRRSGSCPRRASSSATARWARTSSSR